MEKKIAVIGGGFYGIMAAIDASDLSDVSNVVLYEKEDQLFTGAGKYNQARIHHGFHYPRSQRTIDQSKAGFEYYKNRFPDVVMPISNNIYLIREDGCVSIEKYLSVMRKHGLDFEITDMSTFPFKYNAAGINYASILVKEGYINVGILESILKKRLSDADVEVKLGKNVVKIDVNAGEVYTQCGMSEDYDLIINCTYLNPFMGFSKEPVRLKYEYCMMLLIYSKKINDHAITIMDGEFVSIYPWLDGIHSVSSVKYTPIFKSDKLNDLLEKMKNITKSEIEERARLIESHMNKFVDFEYSKISYLLSPKMKIFDDKGDERTVQTFSEGKCFSVIPGKLDAVSIFLSDLELFMESLN